MTGRPEDDDDGDHISNAVELLIEGAHPRRIDKLPKFEVDGNLLTWKVCWNSTALAAGVTPVIEASTDLEEWNIAGQHNGFRELPSAGNCTTVIGSTSTAKYLRVRAIFQLPPE